MTKIPTKKPVKTGFSDTTASGFVKNSLSAPPLFLRCRRESKARRPKLLQMTMHGKCGEMAEEKEWEFPRCAEWDQFKCGQRDNIVVRRGNKRAIGPIDERLQSLGGQIRFEIRDLYLISMCILLIWSLLVSPRPPKPSNSLSSAKLSHMEMTIMSH